MIFRTNSTRDAGDAGHSTLENLGSVPKVAEWTVSQFENYLGGSVFEAGSGSGNITRYLMNRPRLVCVDVDSKHVDELRLLCEGLATITVFHGDLEDAALYDRLGDQVDSVVSVNVVEHLRKPDTALRGFYEILRPGGFAVILVPAHGWLFSEADRALGHWRRYDRGSLVSLCERAGFEIEWVREFNRLGVVGWLVNKLLRRTRIDLWQAKLFGAMLPLAKLLERVSPLPGLSLIAVVRKP